LVQPLKVQVTVSRFDGDKKVMSLPHTILVNASQERAWSKVRMGFEVPVRVGTTDKDGKSPAVTHQYRNVGVNIDCRASTTEDGRYALEGTVEQSSLYEPQVRAGTGPPDLPLFRTFSSPINATLRDGQSMTTATATDPVNGETVRIEVSLTVVR
jgi:Flp pilus assembly secretin CpaC